MAGQTRQYRAQPSEHAPSACGQKALKTGRAISTPNLNKSEWTCKINKHIQYDFPWQVSRFVRYFSHGRQTKLQQANHWQVRGLPCSRCSAQPEKRRRMRHLPRCYSKWDWESNERLTMKFSPNSEANSLAGFNRLAFRFVCRCGKTLRRARLCKRCAKAKQWILLKNDNEQAIYWTVFCGT